MHAVHGRAGLARQVYAMSFMMPRPTLAVTHEEAQGHAEGKTSIHGEAGKIGLLMILDTP